MSKYLSVLLLTTTDALAHGQAYPHVHPHEHVSVTTDALLTGVWIVLAVAFVFAAYKLVSSAETRTTSKAKKE